MPGAVATSRGACIAAVADPARRQALSALRAQLQAGLPADLARLIVTTRRREPGAG